MLRLIKNNKAQMVASEYVIVLFVVLAVMASMSVYFRRTLQGRIRDAHNIMIDIVRNEVGNLYNTTNVYIQYEPYYRNQVSDILRLVDNVDRNIGSFPLSSGIFRKDYNEATSIWQTSTTPPPVNAN